jgi:hypothetical protein
VSFGNVHYYKFFSTSNVPVVEGNAAESYAKCNYCAARVKTATVTPGTCVQKDRAAGFTLGCKPLKIEPNLPYDVPQNPCPRVFCVTNGDAKINGEQKLITID